MQWSLPVGRIAGSEIRIHLTFLLLLLWIGIVHYQSGGASAATEGVLYVIAVFACVVLHEFGHALAARRYGIAHAEDHAAADRRRRRTRKDAGKAFGGDRGGAGRAAGQRGDRRAAHARRRRKRRLRRP